MSVWSLQSRNHQSLQHSSRPRRILKASCQGAEGRTSTAPVLWHLFLFIEQCYLLRNNFLCLFGLRRARIINPCNTRIGRGGFCRRVARGPREGHLGIIGFRNGTHAKYIADRAFREDNEDGFRPMIRKIADITNVNLAVIAQEKFVEHLVQVNERTAADWQLSEWTGENGRYPLVYSCGPGARCVIRIALHA